MLEEAEVIAGCVVETVNRHRASTYRQVAVLYDPSNSGIAGPSVRQASVQSQRAACIAETTRLAPTRFVRITRSILGRSEPMV